jgi:hypothetical protein
VVFNYEVSIDVYYIHVFPALSLYTRLQSSVTLHMELDVPSSNPDVGLHASPTYYGERNGNPPVNPRSQAGSSRIFRSQGSERRNGMKRPLSSAGTATRKGIRVTSALRC